MHKVPLGPPPWSDASLQTAYFADFQEAYRSVDEHPGANLHRLVSELRTSVEIFNELTDALLQVIHDFETAAADPMFWTRARKTSFEDAERRIRAGLFGATAAALALVAHARRINEKCPTDDYDTKRVAIFDREEHAFVQGLRNFASHRSVVLPEWQQVHANRQKTTYLLLMPEFLLMDDGWTAPARAFIARNSTGVRLKELFSSYRAQVTQFYEWWLPALETTDIDNLTAYRMYRRKLDGFGMRMWWKSLFGQIVLPRKLDPYQYLHQYLEESQLAEVLRMERHSREQVDRIIALVDDTNACDEEIRTLAYSAFGVTDE